jgi:hypothetical protein
MTSTGSSPGPWPTLAAAALFTPLRRGVQRAVDQRFNRARYDADQIVMAFAARLKDAVDLDSVLDDLAPSGAGRRGRPGMRPRARPAGQPVGRRGAPRHAAARQGSRPEFPGETSTS